MKFNGGRIIESEFKPARGLYNPHLQTIWPTLFRSHQHIVREFERLELGDGDFLDLYWHRPQYDSLVILLHGLGSSADAKYILGLQKALGETGFASVAINLRGSGKEPNRLATQYHGGASHDLNTLYWQLRERFPRRPIALVGFSLGANILLKWLGEELAPIDAFAAMAISPPFLLHRATEALSQGPSRLYGQYLLHAIKQNQERKIKYFLENPSAQDKDVLQKLPALAQIKTLFEFDDLITAPLHGFQDAHHYYSVSSSRQFLKTIKTPTLIVHAQDDPFIPPDSIPLAEELSPKVVLELSPFGGHVGFVSGTSWSSTNYWIEQRVPQFLKSRGELNPLEN